MKNTEAETAFENPASNDDPQPFAQVERLLQQLEVQVPDYPHDLAILTRLAAHIEKQMILRSNAMLKPHGLNYTMYQVLVIALGSGDTAPTPRDLAEGTGERNTNITHLCDELEKRGLVLRERNNQDRRRVHVLLTAEGRQLLSVLQKKMWELWRTRYDGMQESEQEQLLNIMRRQYQNLGGK